MSDKHANRRQLVAPYAPLAGKRGRRRWVRPDANVPSGVKLMPDYYVDVPLWGDWERLDLSAALLDRLVRWQEYFDRSFHWESGWKTDAARTEWTREARVLEAELRAEVGDRTEVTVDLWPIKKG